VDVDLLVKEIVSGDKRAIAKGITTVENNTALKTDLLKKIFPHLGGAFRIGITGPPGAGKSTMILQLSKLFIRNSYNVGIIAVDPTSPFSGGAVLGDRVRMVELIHDENVFIRSMASRGSVGGLSLSASEASDILEAGGKNIIIFETLGVGQAELEVSSVADTTVVVLVPESGDSIQAMKAGLMEIADIFVVNKSDREGANRAITELELILSLRTRESEWKSPVIPSSALRGEGIEEVYNKIEDHKTFIFENGIIFEKRKKRIVNRVKEIVEEKLKSHFWNEEKKKKVRDFYSNVDKTDVSPYELALELLSDFLKK